jgi:hypothetical protein
VLWFPLAASGKLQVNWPDGEVSEHALAEAKNRVTLSR